MRVDNLSLIELYDSDSRSSTLVSIFLFSGKLRKTHNYAEFNEAILASGEETVMILHSKCQGWYHHSRDTLSPVLNARNEVIYHIRAHKPAPSRQTLDELKKMQ